MEHKVTLDVTGAEYTLTITGPTDDIEDMLAHIWTEEFLQSLAAALAEKMAQAMNGGER